MPENAGLKHRCIDCGMPLLEGPLFMIEGKPYCENCANKLEVEFICDFCNGRDPTWTYESKGLLQIKGIVITTSGKLEQAPEIDLGSSWASCDPCHLLISRGEPRDLATRAFSMIHDPSDFPEDLLEVMTAYFRTVLSVLKFPPRKGMHP